MYNMVTITKIKKEVNFMTATIVVQYQIIPCFRMLSFLIYTSTIIKK
jgi:hypothetical protein